MSAKYAFIDAEYAENADAAPIARMCSWLGVSRSGFFEWRNRHPRRGRCGARS